MMKTSKKNNYKKSAMVFSASVMLKQSTITHLDKLVYLHSIDVFQYILLSFLRPKHDRDDNENLKGRRANIFHLTPNRFVTSW